MNKTNILHITPSLGLGGAETFMYRLIKKDKKFNHFILCLKGKGHYGKKLEEQGYEVFALNIGGSMNPFKIIQQLKLIFQSHTPTILNCWMYHGALFGTLISFFYDKKPLIWLIRHSQLNFRSTKISTFLVAKLCAFLSRKYPESVIYNSEESKEIHEELGYFSQKSVIIHNGFSLDEFYPDKTDSLKLRKNLTISNDDFVFLHIARWHKDKDHETCLKSLALFKSQYKGSWKVIFAGTGMDITNVPLQDIINKNGLSEHCILLGECTDTKELYNVADLTILSSSSESFPNVLGESMSCATPCVSTDVGSAGSLIYNQSWLFPKRDYRQMATILSEAVLLKSNEQDWNDLKKECRKLIENNFSFEKILSSYQSEWEIPQ